MWIRIYAMFLFPPNLVPLSEGLSAKRTEGSSQLLPYQIAVA